MDCRNRFEGGSDEYVSPGALGRPRPRQMAMLSGQFKTLPVQGAIDLVESAVLQTVFDLMFVLAPRSYQYHAMKFTLMAVKNFNLSLVEYPNSIYVA